MNYNKIIFIILGLLVASYITYESPGIVGTFIVSFSFAYLLQPLAKYISTKTYINYKFSSLLVFLGFLIILIALLIFLIPKIIIQLHYLLVKIPEYHKIIKNSFLPFLSDKIELYGGKSLNGKISEVISTITNDGTQYLISSMNSLWYYTLSFINIITLLSLFPVVLVFFLIDWPEITVTFKKFIKNIGLNAINDIWEEIDDLLIGFIKSILNIGAIMSILYIIAFSALGLELSVILGLFSGFAVIIPFIGTFLAFLTCFSLSILNNGFDFQQIWIILIFLSAQIFEGTYLTPKIIGNKIGMHPNTVIFAIFVSAHLFGFTGLLIAIPLAGVTKIIFKRFVLEKAN